MGKVMCMWEQGVYGKSLYMPLNFAVNLNCSKNKGLEKKKKSKLKNDLNKQICFNSSVLQCKRGPAKHHSQSSLDMDTPWCWVHTSEIWPREGPNPSWNWWEPQNAWWTALPTSVTQVMLGVCRALPLDQEYSLVIVLLEFIMLVPEM